MPLDAPAEARGLQVPPQLWVPEYSSSAGEEAIELAAMAGLVLDPWQQFVLKHALGERPDGKWSAFEVALLVSRQNGKGSLTEARELVGLFLLGEDLILHTAHEFKTAAEAFRRILYLIESTSDFERRVKKVTRAHGDEGIELKTGQRLRFIARTGGSGRGFSGDCIILDEAMILSSQVLAALLFTLSARPNPQIWYTSSAGDENSDQLARVVRRGRAGGDPNLAYFDWCADPLDDPGDPRTWAKANPALGIRIAEEHIAREMAAMGGVDFGRERLGIGNYPTEHGAEWKVITEAAWRETTDVRSGILDPVVFAVDVTPDRSMATIAAAGGRTDDRRHVEIVDHAPGTGWVASRLAELRDRWEPKAIALDPGGPAGSLVEAIKTEGIKPLLLTARDLAAACGAFYDAVMDTPSTIRHRGQQDLTAAVKGATKRTLGQAWAWDRQAADSDISPLVAASIALHAHRVAPEPETSKRSYFLN